MKIFVYDKNRFRGVRALTPQAGEGKREGISLDDRE